MMHMLHDSQPCTLLLKHTLGHCSKIRPHRYLVLFLTGLWSAPGQILRLESYHEFADTDIDWRQLHPPAIASGYQKDLFLGWQACSRQLPKVWCGACRLLPALD